MSKDATQFVGAARKDRASAAIDPSAPPIASPSPERHYSGRSFLPSLDIIQCNHPSIKNLLVIKGTTQVNTENMEKDDPVQGDSV